MSKINKSAILLIILLQTSFFSILKTSPTMFIINSYVYKTLIIFLLFLLVIINLFFNSNKSNEKKKLYFLPVMFMWIVIYFLTLWGSQLVYEQGILTTIKNSYVFFMIILYFYLVFFLNTKNYLLFILKSFSIIGSIYSFLLLLQSINFKILDTSAYGLNPIYDSFGPVFHFIRIAGPADFISYSLLLTLIVAIYENNKHIFFTWLIIFLDFFYIAFISGTRMYMIIDLVLIFLYVLISIKPNFPFIFYNFIFVGILGSVAITPFLFKIFTSGSRKMSFQVRLNEIKYYLGKIFYNIWFGIGFPDSRRFDQLIHGPAPGHFGMENSKYFLEDVGAIGSLVVFGFIGILGLIFFVYKLIKFYIESNSKREIIMVYAYLIMMAFTLSLMDPQRIFYLFTSIYILEIFSNDGRKKKYELNNSFSHGKIFI